MTDTEDLRIERTLDAPIELVWAMWTETEHFAGWYGPTGATIPRAEMDVRVGGRRRIDMEVETPGGPMTMAFVGEYHEVDAPTRLVYSESMADGAGAPGETSVVVELTGLGDRTRMVLTHVGVAPDSPGAQGWAMALDKLAARLAALPG
ncbi:hypothetical protein I601_0095 [Nocardioides dokdonensis FR1436]|uniref:Activator of Hsp90 ATPase homologue 1/2-like C-terminal domain-containing protein n=1 Tax=Nocardioides dokdonensis FR1436 TaxID=1300347 RepID=A0A1A9GE11_9ACTN|nr:SRPBCC domain-containing protein [Nocardioides dokdonensis]ANH36549.1 hypothetical protein I601_0095 [Nocardioides dokdonensis FR1436]